MKIDLTGKRVAITAGAAGIGRVTAERFLAVGARVWVCDVDEAALADFRAKNPTAEALRADVGDSRQVDTFFEQLGKELSGLDVLINNAGISGPTKPVEEITDEEWNQTLAVNVSGQFYAVRRVVPWFKRQRSGVIINLSSTAGRMGMPLRSPYSTSKYAVRGFTDVLAVELGEYNVRVNAILPGMINGPRARRVITEQAAARGQTYEEYLPAMLHNVSMHTMIEMEEIADMAVFLSSDHGRHISGQSIGICGNFESYRAPLRV